MKKQILSIAVGLLSLGAIAQTTPGANNLVGFAKLAGTTGGKGAIAITVRTFEELKAAVVWSASTPNSAPKIVLVEGILAPAPTPLDAPSNAGRNQQINISSNTTIIGKTGSAIQGVQLFFKVGAQNIILRNLNLQFTSNANANHTLISFDGKCSKIWIDHCEFSNPANLTRDRLDAFVKIPSGSSARDVDSVTVSWCKFGTNPEGGILMNAPAVTTDRHVTIHHNYFEGTLESMVFSGGPNTSDTLSKVDIFNNYFANITSVNFGVSPAEDWTDALGIKGKVCGNVKNNVFENVIGARGTEGPITLDLVSDADLGMPNSNVNLGTTTAGTAITETAFCAFNGGTGYAATIPAGIIEPTSSVATSTKAYAGAKITDATILAGGEQDPTGVEEELIFNSGKFYPNPFTNEFTISLGRSFEYAVADITGRTMESGVSIGEVSVGQSLPSGMYFVKITMGNALRVVKANKK